MYSYTKFIYLDTNILSNLCTETALYQPFFNFLSKNDLTMAISAGLLSELSQVTRKHSDLDWLLTMCPSALVKTDEMLLREEVQAYPNYSKETLMLYPLNHLTGTKFIEECLSSTNLAEARRIQLTFAERQKDRHEKLKGNFPPARSGKYTKEQAPEFVWMHLCQMLTAQHPNFMKQFQDNIAAFKPEVFLSGQIFPYVLYYKYYLGGRTPKLSDFGDLFHLACIPYCDIVVLEKDLCEILRQIKSHQNVLENVTITNYKFIHKLKK